MGGFIAIIEALTAYGLKNYHPNIDLKGRDQYKNGSGFNIFQDYVSPPVLKCWRETDYRFNHLSRFVSFFLSVIWEIFLFIIRNHFF